MSRSIALPLLAACLLPAAWVASEESPGPPKVLVVAREEIKPGMMSSHEKIAAGFLATISKTKLESYRLGLTPVSGDDNQVLYLEGHDSFAALEASQKAWDAELAANAAFKASLDQLESQGGPMHASQKTAIATYREDLSYRPSKMAEAAKARYFTIMTVRVKPGRIGDYVDFVKQYNAARAKANLDEHSAAFQVLSGAPTGTFLFFSLNRSLTEWDDFRRGMDARSKSVDEALGGDLVIKHRREVASEIIADSMSNLYAVKASISRPDPQFAAGDPDFWSPKPKLPAKTTAAKKDTPKP